LPGDKARLHHRTQVVEIAAHPALAEPERRAEIGEHESQRRVESHDPREAEAAARVREHREVGERENAREVDRRERERDDAEGDAGAPCVPARRGRLLDRRLGHRSTR
jgi:hypothetical protein